LSLTELRSKRLYPVETPTKSPLVRSPRVTIPKKLKATRLPLQRRTFSRIFFDAELELYAPPPESELKEEEEDSQLLAPHCSLGNMEEAWKNVIAGTAGGVAICAVGHPFDTIKVRLQTQGHTAQRHQQLLYRNTWDCFVKTLKWEGIGGLYKGVASPLIGQMFFRATLFSSFGQAKKVVSSAFGARSDSALPPVGHFLAGMITGACASFVEGPIDLLKSQVQVQILAERQGTPRTSKYNFRNVFQCARVITTHYGLRGIYQGLSATLLRNTPAFSMYFGFNELTRRALASPGQSTASLEGWKYLVAGGTGGFLYWFLTYPADVIKSSMQADSLEASQRKYHNILHCARTLYAEAGIRRFFRGWTPCILRSVPANAVLWVVFEKVRKLIG